MESAMRLGTENPVVMFGKSTCGISHAIEMLIRSYGANPIVYKLDEVSNGRQLEEELMALGCNPSVPAVFIGKKLVGGSNEIMSLNVKGKLKPLLMKAKAIWI